MGSNDATTVEREPETADPATPANPGVRSGDPRGDNSDQEGRWDNPRDGRGDQ